MDILLENNCAIIYTPLLSEMATDNLGLNLSLALFVGKALKYLNTEERDKLTEWLKNVKTKQ